MDYKFQFVNYDVEVEVGNNTFVLSCTAETGDYMKKVGKSFTELAIAINDGEKTTADAIAYGTEVVDHLLGVGATEKIFAGRKKKVDDFSDLCLFLMNTITEFRAKHKPTFNDHPRNRDERRKR